MELARSEEQTLQFLYDYFHIVIQNEFICDVKLSLASLCDMTAIITISLCKTKPSFTILHSSLSTLIHSRPPKYLTF
ncbi:hypothetical protein E2C01_044294 [Portunus trituberculatus]|uniref:Uncharacterized protein n=1 Tax=Portunus trituberculatus TaxID=210409 RepID=A0A5B7FYU2_PORTR|nr:hypothetical protein [Portunus trituberculatus]